MGASFPKLDKAWKGLCSQALMGQLAPVCQQGSGMSTAADFTNHGSHSRSLELGTSGHKSSALLLQRSHRDLAKKAEVKTLSKEKAEQALVQL